MTIVGDRQWRRPLTTRMAQQPPLTVSTGYMHDLARHTTFIG